MTTRALAILAFVLITTVVLGTAAACQQQSVSSYLPPKDSHIIDLAVFRWICAQSSIKAETPLLVRAITRAAARPDSKTQNWVIVGFAADGSPGKLVSPDAGDTRVPKLIELKSAISSALGYRESYPVESVSRLKSVMNTAGELDLTISQAMLWKLVGDFYLYDMARYNEANIYYNRASLVFDQAAEATAISAILFDDLAFLSSEQGRYDQARDNYVQAAYHWQALALQNPTNLSYRFLSGKEYLQAGEAQRASGKPDAAINLKNQGLEETRKYAYGTKDYAPLVQALMESAELFVERGDSARADKALAEAGKLVGPLEDVLLVARYYRTCAELAELSGKKTEVAGHYKGYTRTLTIAARVGEEAFLKLSMRGPIKQSAKQKMIESVVVGAQSYMLLKTAQGTDAYQAQKHVKRAVALWEFAASYYGKDNNPDQQVYALRALSGVYAGMKEADKSRKALESAVSVAQSSQRNTLVLEVLQDYVSYLEQRNNKDEAARVYLKLISTAESMGNIRTGAAARVARGKLLASTGKYEEAAKDLTFASDRYLKLIGDIWASVETSIDLADIYIKSGNNQEAISVLEKSASETEASFTNSGSEFEAGRSRQNLMVGMNGRLIRLYIGTGQLEQAELLMRRFDNRPWLPMLLRDLTDDTDNGASAFVARIISNSGPSTPVSGGSSTNRLAQDAAGFTRVCWSLAETRKSEYRALPVDPLAVLAQRHEMPAGSVLVEYMFTENSIYIFVIGPSLTECVEVNDAAADVTDAYRQLKRILKKCEESLGSGVPVAPVLERSEPAFLEIADPLAKLHSLMLAPIAGKIPEDSLLIIALPDQLAGMPMHALIFTDTKGKPAFVCEKYNVSYLGASGLRALATPARTAGPTDKLVIFADPNGDLPGALKEAEIISAVFPGAKVYKGAQATASAFFTELSSADIVHIAAHHAPGANQPQQILKLAKGPDSDGIITLSALLDKQPLRARLVFLSTCDSLFATDSATASLNKTGEAFLLAGASTVVGGLWKVSDKAQAYLAGEFYKGLNQGESYYKAIRRAQLSMIKSSDGKFTHPYYWAALALYGSPR